jgi:hypothetical protein
MHSINAIFLIGDTALNSLVSSCISFSTSIIVCVSENSYPSIPFVFFQPFPWFRMGYFCLWTVTYVIFQWIVHACINLWYNKPLFLVLTQLLRRKKTHYYLIQVFLSWKTGGLIHFLICPPHLLHYGMNFIPFPLSSENWFLCH